MTRSLQRQRSRSPALGRRLWLALLIWAALSASVILGVGRLLTRPPHVVRPAMADVGSRPVSDPGFSPPTAQSGAQLLPDNTSTSVQAVQAAPVAALPASPTLNQPVISTQAPSAPRALMDVPRYPQERNLNCELRSATVLAAFYGWNFAWKELFVVVGHDPNGDPNIGFVGRSMDDPVGGIYPAGYGVHADPVARGLRRLGIAASAHHGVDAAWLRDQIYAGR
ncbi:MAG: hypothetical protein KDH89_19145, partial [Anaerolineae bacterium]|nr:hypothetical protein [Anaerolineae bacterium]